MNVSFKKLFGRGLNEGEKAEGVLLDQIIHVNSTFSLLFSSVQFFPFLRYCPSFTFLGPIVKCCDKIYDTAKVSLSNGAGAEVSF